jgi:hypothetical protein
MKTLTAKDICMKYYYDNNEDFEKEQFISLSDHQKVLDEIEKELDFQNMFRDINMKGEEMFFLTKEDIDKTKQIINKARGKE